MYIKFKKVFLPLLCVAIFFSTLCGCTKLSDENCVFVNETANLHDEYLVTVIDAQTVETVNVLKNKDDIEKSILIGSDCHYIEVTVKIKHQNISTPKEYHELDVNDFKLKDHTGIKLSNLHINSVKDGYSVSNKTFSTTKAITDYTWIGKEIPKDTEETLKIYFEFDKDISVESTLMILEVDFFATKTGTDIVIAQRAEN